MRRPTIDEKSGTNSPRTANFLLIYFLGVSTVLGTQVSYWNEGLAHDFWPLFGSLFIMISGYVCLALCLSEMSAALPFSGGTFGLARVTLGQVPGYLLGMGEMVEYVMYVALAAHSIGQLMTEVTGFHRKYEPIFWVVFYASGFIIQLSKPAVIWGFITVFGVIILLYISVFIVAVPGAAHANFERFALLRDSNSKTTSSFIFHLFQCMPYSSWLFVGIETLPMASGDAKQPSRTVPQAIRYLILTLVPTSIAVVLVASSISPGAVSREFYKSHSPLSYGYSAMLGISYSQSTIVTIVIKYITGFGFMFAYGRQISAMQRSGLVMTVCMKIWGEKNSLRRGLMLGFVGGLLGLGFIWHFNPAYFQHIHSACLLGNYLVCLGICCSYIQFRRKYSSLAKNYRSVFGVYGAVYGVLVFSVAFVSLAGFQDDAGMGVFTLACFMSYMVLRYLVYNWGRPTISQEEQSVLFVLYVINANTARKKHIAELTLARAAKENRANFCRRIVLDNNSSDSSASLHSTSLGARLKRTTGPMRATLDRYLGLSRRDIPQDSHSDEDAGITKRPPSKSASHLTTGDSVTYFDLDGSNHSSEVVTTSRPSEEPSRRTILPPMHRQDTDITQLERRLDDNNMTVTDLELVDENAASTPIVLRRSFTSPTKQSPPDFEDSPKVTHLSGSKKFSDTFGSTKLGSQKFSASEGGVLSGKNSHSSSADAATIEGFATEFSDNEKNRLTILDIIENDSPLEGSNVSLRKIAPEMSPAVNSAQHNMNATRRSHCVVELTLSSIEESQELSRRICESPRAKPQGSSRGTALQEQDSSIIVTMQYVECSASLKPPPLLNSSAHIRSSSSSPALVDRNSSEENSKDGDEFPSPSIHPAPSRSRASQFNFRFFSSGRHKPSVNPKRRMSISSMMGTVGGSVKYEPGDDDKMDSSIMDMYSDEVQEFFSHNGGDESDV